MIMLASIVFIIFMSGIQAGWFIIGGIIVAIILGTLVYISVSYTHLDVYKRQIYYYIINNIPLF